MSLQSGAVDVFAHLTTTQVPQLGDGFHVEEGTMNLVQALYLNNAEEPFDDVRVRQALCYAVDRQQIIDLAFDGYGSPSAPACTPPSEVFCGGPDRLLYLRHRNRPRSCWRRPVIPTGST